MTQTCKTCPTFLDRDNITTQEKVYGVALGVPACPRVGRLLGTNSMSSENEASLQEEIGTACSKHNQPVTKGERTFISLSIGIGQPAKTVEESSVRSCRSCHYYINSTKMEREVGVKLGLCSMFGKLLPNTQCTEVASNCRASGRLELEPGKTADQHQDELLSRVRLDPELRKYLNLGDIIESSIEVAVKETPDPSVYPTDMPVSDDHKAKGIRAWRKMKRGTKEVYLPIFDIEFFDDNERAKIPRSGDDEHPEQYMDHMDLAFTTAVLWRELDETPALHGVAGTGKGHPVDTKVLTPEGWRRVGDVRVGDEVIGKDGQATKILGVFPRGKLHVNKVTMTDGASVVVDDDHLWQVDDLQLRVPGSKTLRGKPRVVRTGDLDNLHMGTSKGYRYRIPMVEPVQFAERDLPVHPYVLGVLLANGSLGSGEAVYSSNDQDVIDVVGKLVTQVERTPTPTRRHVIKSGVWKQLIQLGLNGRVSAQKFIPESYLRAAEWQRRNLLAGLLDCDGSASAGHTRYHTTSPMLADGVVELVRSLGGTATIQYSSRDNEMCVNISLGDSNPFHSSAKKDRRNSGAHRPPVRKIKSIEDAGEAEVVCISVAADDQLYVTEDYIVTHNTEFFRYMAWLMCLPFERVSITKSTELDDLAGKTHFENEETVFKQGRIPRAWAKPCVIVLDEPNVGSPEVWQFVRPLTDNSKQMVLDMNEGEVIRRNDHAYLGMAMNPAWDMRNIGAEVISDADGSRLMHIFVSLPDAKMEKKIIRDRCKLDGYEIDEDLLSVIMKIAVDLRALADDQTLPITWGIRNQIKVARATRWFDLRQSYLLASADYLEPTVRDMILDTVKNHKA